MTASVLQSLLQSHSPLAAIATTPRTAQLLAPLCSQLGATLWVPPSLVELQLGEVYDSPLATHLRNLWSAQRGIIFGLAAGAVVRLIAPLLTDKTQDPGVVVIDPGGNYVISLCGGHMGGGDDLAIYLAQLLGATPILTGAAVAEGLPSLDCMGNAFGWQRGQGDWNAVSAAIAHGKSITVFQSAGTSLWQKGLSAHHPFQNAAHTEVAQVVIATTKPSSSTIEQVYWHPRVLWVGIGCERGTAQSLIAEAIQQTMLQHDLAMEAIAGVATLDLKEDEPGLLEFCHITNLPLTCFSAVELQNITVPNPSSVVEAAVGTPSVAEAAALAAAQQVGIELLPQPPALKVPKQVFRKVGEPGAVTVAISQAELEWTGRTGQLYLIGSGPGALEQMTPAALVAATQADVVIGYSLYLELLQSRFRPGQIIEPSPITQERQRAQRAIALAKWGLTVAVISSGDAGIYGMAGLVLEELQAQGWDGKTPAVQIFPGVSALQAAASRVGTPLMHDFCAISLSDHLTPWEVIEKRLEAAAQADFVTAFYNPRSQVRVEQILKAQQIFLKYRNPQTPVALVRAAYRPDEEIQLTTLEKLNDAAIDMLTTVLIGNATTRIFQAWMITPRGYLGFENNSDSGNSIS
jgi:cobalt-precorrin 5A hydrolase / precorrin-3B C17-methyltransferase